MYYIYCLHTKKAVSQEMTIQVAFNELKHVGGFGIASGLTDRPILLKPMGTFRLPKRFSESILPKINKSYWF
jgi:hypothetical protein